MQEPRHCFLSVLTAALFVLNVAQCRAFSQQTCLNCPPPDLQSGPHGQPGDDFPPIANPARVAFLIYVPEGAHLDRVTVEVVSPEHKTLVRTFSLGKQHWNDTIKGYSIVLAWNDRTVALLSQASFRKSRIHVELHGAAAGVVVKAVVRALQQE